MRIVFCADIHGNHYAFDTFYNRMQAEKPDIIVFCGDVFGYFYGQENILSKMRKMKNLVCVMGNHDQYFLEVLEGLRDEEELILRYGNSYHNIEHKIDSLNVQFVKEFLPYWYFQQDGIRIGAYHGSPDDYREARVYPDTEVLSVTNYIEYNYVILGHTHHKMVRHIGGTTVINPGSLGQQRDGKGCSYLQFDTMVGSYTFQEVEYDVASLLMEIEKYDSGREGLKEVLQR